MEVGVGEFSASESVKECRSDNGCGLRFGLNSLAGSLRSWSSWSDTGIG